MATGILSLQENSLWKTELLPDDAQAVLAGHPFLRRKEAEVSETAVWKTFACGTHPEALKRQSTISFREIVPRQLPPETAVF